ncbi:MAG: PQQ-dependent sugar dehydrogenase [Holophagales bacterium]|nr:PQQ-dependent sugar dehydrogenase [Holophagales bacterium]
MIRALACSVLLAAAPAFAAVEPVLVASGLSAPLRVTAPAGDFQRLFVVEQGGKVRVVKDGILLGSSFLDLSGRISSGGERGLLGLAFHPEYRRNGRFFASYTDPLGNSVVSEFTVSSNSDFANPGSERVLLRQTQPFSNHNGGHLAFSPIDGSLYLGFGDGGSGGDPQNLAQNDGTWLGKILRIDVDARDAGKAYAVPDDNPFAGRTNPLPEIWAKGLRNPWRFSFDRLNGDLWIGDVGQGSWEEVDWQGASSKGGENYGWRRMEGSRCYDPATGCQTGSLTLPIVEYAHAANPPRCSVTGGVVARGASVPEIAGRYLFADYCSGELFSVRRLGREAIDARNHRAEWVPAGGRSIASVTDIGEDARGDVYVTDSAGGEVFRLATTTPSAVRLVPIVLDATGRGDSRFLTELVVANRGASTATIRATYTPAAIFGGAGGGTVSELIGRGQQKSWSDALAWLRFKGLAIPEATQGSQGGTLRVELTGLVAATDGVVLARTTTPSGSGRAGLSTPAPRAQDLVAETAVLYGLRETASDRTNLALLSGATSGATLLRVTLFSGGRTFVLPETVRLEPGAWVQLDSVLSRAGFAGGWAVVERIAGPGPFWAYAVFNDNVTSDGSYVAPVLPVRPVATQVVPVVVETTGFESELVLANPGTSSVTARLLWVESLAAATPRRFVAAEALAAGEQKILTGFVDRLRSKGLPVGGRGGSYAGALFVTFENASGRAVQGYAGARTASPAPGGGAYGLFTPGVTADDLAWREAWLFGLRQDESVRTNLALVNADPDGGAVTLRYEVFEGTAGRKVGTSRDLVLGPGEWVQVDRVLRDFALRDGYVRVLRVSGSERFLAYAVVNDGPVPGGAGTHDGSFVPMEAAE